MAINYEERFRKLEEKIDKMLEYRKDFKSIQKLLKFIKKNKKYFRFAIDVMLFISTILGFFVI